MLDRLLYDVILDNVIVKNIYKLFVHNYDINGFLNLKLVNKHSKKLLMKKKFKKYLNKKIPFFVDSFNEYKRDFQNELIKINYKMRILYKAR